MADPHTHPTYLRIPKPLHEAIAREAERRGLNRSQTLRALLAEALGQPELAALPKASEEASALGSRRW